jgi:[ribosomal protein S5]-alanine N-acetyltransferase
MNEGARRVIPFDAIGERVGIRRPRAEDCDEFIALMRQSVALHDPWVDFPKSRETFDAYLRQRQSQTDDGFLICERGGGRITGVINLNCIVRGFFQSAYLGYCVGARFARQGYMTEGMRLVTRYAFTEMNLHRVEANVQPNNAASIALVRKCGFRLEGVSPRYLKIAGAWRDHERWALLADEAT